MPHRLQEHVAVIRRRARGALRMYSAGVVAVVLLVAIGLFGGLDALMRIQDTGWHFVFFGLTIGIVGAVVYFVVVPALRLRLDDVDIARRIETIYPHLKDRLSSSVAFLRQADEGPTAGSAELRQALIDRTSSECAQVNPDDIVDLRPVYRVCLLASFLALPCLGFFVWQPNSARLALRHLLMPWYEDAWPRRHDLAFVGAQVRAARGTDMEFVVVDRNGQLPAAVQLLVWKESTDESEIKPIEMVYRGGKMVCRVEKVQSSFWYRAVGGDDDTMKWHPLDVMEPVGVADLTVRAVPPAYTGLPTRTFRDSFTAWEGSQVDVHGRATQPLSSATLNWQAETSHGVVLLDVRPPDDGPRADKSTANIFGTSSRRPWQVYESGSYWLELVGPKNIIGGREHRWPLRVLRDRPPTLSLAESLSSSEVTPTAIIPIHLVVDDELAVRRVELRYTRSDRPAQPEFAIELFAGPEEPPQVALAAADTLDPPRDRRQIETVWDLSQLSDLAPGVTLMVRFTAGDYKPQEGEISARRLNVVSSAEKKSQIVQRQTAILGQLGQIVTSQRGVRDDTQALLEAVASQALTQDSVDRVRALELRQRAVHERLSLDPESIRVHVSQLLREIEANRILIPEVQRELGSLGETLTRLSREPLGLADSLLTRAAKTVRDVDATAAASEDLTQWLSETDRHQERVVDVLSAALERLKQWEGYQQFAEEIQAIARQQQGLLSETQAFRSRTMSGEHAATEAEDDLVREQIARRELELSRRLHRLQERVEQTAARLRQNDPQAAATLSGAAAVAREHALGGRMRDTSRQIRDRQLGQAVEQQREILDGLRQVERRFHGDPDAGQSPQQLAEDDRQQRAQAIGQQIGRIENAVSMLRDRQERINENTAQLAELAGPQQVDATDFNVATRELVGRQQTLGEATTELAGQIGSLPAFALALRRAAEFMHVAAAALDEEGLQGQFARPQAAALQSLSQILTAISQPAPDEQEPVASEATSTEGQQDGKPAQRAGASRQELQLLRIMQQDIAERTIEIDTEARQQGALDAAQRQDVIRLAKQQAELADVVQQLTPATEEQKPPVDDDTGSGSAIEAMLQESLQGVFDEK